MAADGGRAGVCHAPAGGLAGLAIPEVRGSRLLIPNFELPSAARLRSHALSAILEEHTVVAGLLPRVLP